MNTGDKVRKFPGWQVREVPSEIYTPDLEGHKKIGIT
jgi:hypothetical protein